MQPELYYARCYEPFYLCRKGKPVMAERGRSNVFSFAGASTKYHPTQRPVPLIEEIFSTLSAGMDTVFVPFLGSGATLRACYNRGLKGFGFDLDGKYRDKFMLAVEEDTRKLFNQG
jgi:DNA modification methylase